MGRVEPAQDTGPDQEIVDQGIDRDHGRANFGPSGPIGSAAEQQARQRDAQHLVRYPVKVPQRPQNGFPHSADPIRRSWTIGLSEPPIEPADHISVSDVPNEKEQAVGHLVYGAVPEPMGRQGAGRDVVGLGRCPNPCGTGTDGNANSS